MHGSAVVNEPPSSLEPLLGRLVRRRLQYRRWLDPGRCSVPCISARQTGSSLSPEPEDQVRDEQKDDGDDGRDGQSELAGEPESASSGRDSSREGGLTKMPEIRRMMECDSPGMMPSWVSQLDQVAYPEA